MKLNNWRRLSLLKPNLNLMSLNRFNRRRWLWSLPSISNSVKPNPLKISNLIFQEKNELLKMKMKTRSPSQKNHACNKKYPKRLDLKMDKWDSNFVNLTLSTTCELLLREEERQLRKGWNEQNHQFWLISISILSYSVPLFLFYEISTLKKRLSLLPHA